MAGHGRHVWVETPDGRRLICHPRGKKSQTVVGDQVLWQATQDEGTIDAPIGRHVRDRTRMSLHTTAGKRAVTHFRVLGRAGGSAGARRRELLAGQLPQACDLLAVCLEAGLPLRLAAAEVALREVGPPPSGERITQPPPPIAG